MIFILKLIGVLIFSVVGIVGLLASVCGGVAFSGSFFNLGRMALSFGALVIGGLVAVYSFKFVGKLLATEQTEPDMDPEYPMGDTPPDADAFTAAAPDTPTDIAHQLESPEVGPASKRSPQDSD